MDNVIIAKASTVERCLKRIDEEYTQNPKLFRDNFAKQDSVILNLERLIQATIDIGAHIIKVKELGMINTYREIFEILEEHTILDADQSHQLKLMVGFRNIAIHEYQNLNLDIVESIIRHHLPVIKAFINTALHLKLTSK